METFFETYRYQAENLGEIFNCKLMTLAELNNSQPKVERVKKEIGNTAFLLKYAKIFHFKEASSLLIGHSLNNTDPLGKLKKYCARVVKWSTNFHGSRYLHLKKLTDLLPISKLLTPKSSILRVYAVVGCTLNEICTRMTKVEESRSMTFLHLFPLPKH